MSKFYIEAICRRQVARAYLTANYSTFTLETNGQNVGLSQKSVRIAESVKPSCELEDIAQCTLCGACFNKLLF